MSCACPKRDQTAIDDGEDSAFGLHGGVGWPD
jgi:hypothetical protein